MSHLKRDHGLKRHQGPDHTAPYPVSRLGAPVDLVDTAREIQEAHRAVGNRTHAKLSVIVQQIRALQEQARSVLEADRQDMELHRARCNFQRRPGAVYHLYRRDDGERYFSMLAPDEWRHGPPHAFEGSYRLEADLSWTPLEALDDAGDPDETEATVRRLMADPLHHPSE